MHKVHQKYSENGRNSSDSFILVISPYCILTIKNMMDQISRRARTALFSVPYPFEMPVMYHHTRSSLQPDSRSSISTHGHDGVHLLNRIVASSCFTCTRNRYQRRTGVCSFHIHNILLQENFRHYCAEILVESTVDESVHVWFHCDHHES